MPITAAAVVTSIPLTAAVAERDGCVPARASVFQELFQNGFRHATSLGLSRDSISKALELARVEVADAVVLLGRHNHGNVAVLTSNDDRFTLGRVQ